MKKISILLVLLFTLLLFMFNICPKYVRKLNLRHKKSDYNRPPSRPYSSRNSTMKRNMPAQKGTGNIHDLEGKAFKLSLGQQVFGVRHVAFRLSLFITCVGMQLKVSLKLVEYTRFKLKVSLLRHPMILHLDYTILYQFLTCR